MGNNLDKTTKMGTKSTPEYGKLPFKTVNLCVNGKQMEKKEKKTKFVISRKNMKENVLNSNFVDLKKMRKKKTIPSPYSTKTKEEYQLINHVK